MSPAAHTGLDPEASERRLEPLPDVPCKLFASRQCRYHVYQGIPKALTRQHERGGEVEAKVGRVGVDEVVDPVYA